MPPDLDKPGYMANIIPGAVPSSGVAALRYAGGTLLSKWTRSWQQRGYGSLSS